MTDNLARGDADDDASPFKSPQDSFCLTAPEDVQHNARVEN
jgi:hypothetical protein